MNIIGQDKLCNWIMNQTLDSFPRSLLLIGPQGSGKHLISTFIGDHLACSIIDITERLDLETINAIYEQVEPYVYVINTINISVKEENTILKLLEEPLKNAFIILLAEAETGLLPTIINRCQVQYLNPYSKECLKTFLAKEDTSILEIALTPGDVLKLNTTSAVDMIALADKLIDKIHIATIPNTLTIADKLNWKDDSTKFDYNLFIRILLSQIRNKLSRAQDAKLYNLYELTLTLNKNSQIKNIDKRYLFEKYLIDARALMKGDLL